MLELKNINVSYQNHSVIEDLSIAFQEQETTAIVGPSGAGKSTLLRTLNLLNIPTSGVISFNGQELTFPKKYPKKFLNRFRQNFGMVFQNFNLFPHLTVLENVMEGPVHVQKRDRKTVEHEARKSLTKVGLAAKADSYPAQLSGGQQQRVAIARAMAMHPKFLFFDEPTSALDPELENEVLNVIGELASKQNSQIIVTHNLNFAREAADRIIFFEDGQVLFDGTPDEFFASDSPRIQQFTKKILK